MKELLNQTAPDIQLDDQDGKTWKLSEQRGKWVVVYFYPKDDTPGCSVEACSLRDTQEDLSQLGATVVGISMDDLKSHQKFQAKYNLNFRLLSDPDKVAIEAYGAWGPKMFGKLGILRKTYIIDPSGIIRKIYGRVTPVGHGEQVAKEIEKLKNA